MWSAVLWSVVATLSLQADAGERHIPLGLDQRVLVAAHNPTTQAKIELGRRLFFEPLLSADNTVSCATCHAPDLAFTDGHPVSSGVEGRRGRRNAPTLVNRVYGTSFGWDGRARSIEEQVLRAIQGPREMNLPLSALEDRMNALAHYRNAFERVVGGPATSAAIGETIATFVRSMFSADSPFDRFDHGERGALSPEARVGLDLFRGKGNCIRCHAGATFSDEGFHNTGVAWRDGIPSDSGRYVVTGREADIGSFKTPTLRDVARTGPYMHDGSLATLEDVLEFYDRGGNPNPYLDSAIRPLALSADEKTALLAFLRALSGGSSSHGNLDRRR